MWAGSSHLFRFAEVHLDMAQQNWVEFLAKIIPALLDGMKEWLIPERWSQDMDTFASVAGGDSRPTPSP